MGFSFCSKQKRLLNSNDTWTRTTSKFRRFGTFCFAVVGFSRAVVMFVCIDFGCSGDYLEGLFFLFAHVFSRIYSPSLLASLALVCFSQQLLYFTFGFFRPIQSSPFVCSRSLTFPFVLPRPFCGRPCSVTSYRSLLSRCLLFSVLYACIFTAFPAISLRSN